VFWDNTPCSVITIYPRFSGTWRINIPPKPGRIFLNRSKVKGKGKGKIHPRTGHKGPEVEYRYKGKSKVHPCTGTEALYRPYSP